MALTAKQLQAIKNILTLAHTGDEDAWKQWEQIYSRGSYYDTPYKSHPIEAADIPTLQTYVQELLKDDPKGNAAILSANCLYLQYKKSKKNSWDPLSNEEVTSIIQLYDSIAVENPRILEQKINLYNSTERHCDAATLCMQNERYADAATQILNAYRQHYSLSALQKKSLEQDVLAIEALLKNPTNISEKDINDIQNNLAALYCLRATNNIFETPVGQEEQIREYLQGVTLFCDIQQYEQLSSQLLHSVPPFTQEGLKYFEQTIKGISDTDSKKEATLALVDTFMSLAKLASKKINQRQNELNIIKKGEENYYFVSQEELEQDISQLSTSMNAYLQQGLTIFASQTSAPANQTESDSAPATPYWIREIYQSHPEWKEACTTAFVTIISNTPDKEQKKLLEKHLASLYQAAAAASLGGGGAEEAPVDAETLEKQKNYLQQSLALHLKHQDVKECIQLYDHVKQRYPDLLDTLFPTGSSDLTIKQMYFDLKLQEALRSSENTEQRRTALKALHQAAVTTEQKNHIQRAVAETYLQEANQVTTPHEQKIHVTEVELEQLQWGASPKTTAKEIEAKRQELHTLAKQPDSPDALMAKKTKKLELYQQAIAILEKIADKNPETQEILNNLYLDFARMYIQEAQELKTPHEEAVSKKRQELQWSETEPPQETINDKHKELNTLSRQVDKPADVKIKEEKKQELHQKAITLLEKIADKHREAQKMLCELQQIPAERYLQEALTVKTPHEIAIDTALKACHQQNVDTPDSEELISNKWKIYQTLRDTPDTPKEVIAKKKKIQQLRQKAATILEKIADKDISANLRLAREIYADNPQKIEQCLNKAFSLRDPNHIEETIRLVLFCTHQFSENKTTLETYYQKGLEFLKKAFLDTHARINLLNLFIEINREYFRAARGLSIESLQALPSLRKLEELNNVQYWDGSKHEFYQSLPLFIDGLRFLADSDITPQFKELRDQLETLHSMSMGPATQDASHAKSQLLEALSDAQFTYFSHLHAACAKNNRTEAGEVIPFTAVDLAALQTTFIEACNVAREQYKQQMPNEEELCVEMAAIDIEKAKQYDKKSKEYPALIQKATTSLGAIAEKSLPANLLLAQITDNPATKKQYMDKAFELGGFAGVAAQYFHQMHNPSTDFKAKTKAYQDGMAFVKEGFSQENADISILEIFMALNATYLNIGGEICSVKTPPLSTLETINTNSPQEQQYQNLPLLLNGLKFFENSGISAKIKDIKTQLDDLRARNKKDTMTQAIIAMQTLHRELCEAQTNYLLSLNDNFKKYYKNEGDDANHEKAIIEKETLQGLQKHFCETCLKAIETPATVATLRGHRGVKAWGVVQALKELLDTIKAWFSKDSKENIKLSSTKTGFFATTSSNRIEAARRVISKAKPPAPGGA